MSCTGDSDSLRALAREHVRAAEEIGRLASRASFVFEGASFAGPARQRLSDSLADWKADLLKANRDLLRTAKMLDRHSQWIDDAHRREQWERRIRRGR
jgi:hypothetical protein